MCLLVTRYPRSEYIRPALDCLESMYALFQSNSTSNHVARKNLVSERLSALLFKSVLTSTKGHDYTFTVNRA